MVWVVFKRPFLIVQSPFSIDAKIKLRMVALLERESKQASKRVCVCVYVSTHVGVVLTSMYSKRQAGQVFTVYKTCNCGGCGLGTSFPLEEEGVRGRGGGLIKTQQASKEGSGCYKESGNGIRL